uniref:Thioredoxin domain-containing protein PLP3B n=1 Tax=Zea mays TaxID=4577 RepID=A0A804RH36_MAIZE
MIVVLVCSGVADPVNLPSGSPAAAVFVASLCSSFFRIMDKHLKTLAPVYVGTKFVKLDAEYAPFFVAKLAIKTLPCVILFKKDIVVDRLVGFQDLRSKDDFLTRALEHILILKTKGIIDEKKKDDDDDDEESEAKNRRVRSSTAQDSDSD